jgi:hypothetical protein
MREKCNRRDPGSEEAGVAEGVRSYGYPQIMLRGFGTFNPVDAISVPHVVSVNMPRK